MKHEEGFEVPIHRSLTEPILVAGVPSKLAYFVLTLAGVFGLGMRSWYVLPILGIVWAGAVLVHKKDPYAFDVFLRHIRQKKYFSV